MKHPYFAKAVMTAYDRLVPQGEQVPYFIFFEVNPHDIDVNIHPTKTEIKFENEQAIWQILAAAVKESLGVYNDVPTIDFDVQGKPEIPVFVPVDDVNAPQVDYDPNYNPFNTSSADLETSIPKSNGYTFESKVNAGSFSSKKTLGSHVPDQWEQLYQGLAKKKMLMISQNHKHCLGHNLKQSKTQRFLLLALSKISRLRTISIKVLTS